MGAGIAGDEIAERIGHGREERRRQAAWERDPERIAEAARVLDGGEAALPPDREGEDPVGVAQRRQERRRRLRWSTALGDLRLREVADGEQEIVQAVGVDGGTVAAQVLERPREVGDGGGVEQLPQLGLAEQLAELRGVDAERVGAALGQGGVAVVEEVADVREHQRGGEGRGHARVDGAHADLLRGDAPEQIHEAGQVEDVAQALAVGLQEQRERAVARGDREQVGRLLARGPERRALPGMPPRQEQRAAGVLAEARGEDRGGAEAADEEVLDLVGGGEEGRHVGRLLGSREAEDHAVVGPDALDVREVSLTQAREHRRAPGRVDARAEGGEHAHPEVADLVAVALDHQRAIAGHLPGGGGLLAQVGEQIVGGPLVEAVRRAQPRERGGGLLGEQRAGEGSHRAAQLGRAAGAVAAPEGHLAGLAGGGRDQHAIVGDLGDAPRRGAEEEDLADARLEDHLFVELADAAALLLASLTLGDVDPVEPAVGDGAAVDDRDAPRPLARGERAGDPIPGEAGPQLGELVGGVAPREHVEHALEGRSRQLGEGGRPAHQRVDGVRGARLHAHGGDDLLGEHVERVPRVKRLLDRARHHPLRGGGRREQVALVLGEDDPARHRAHRVPGAPDALQAGGDRGRRLDLHHQIDGAHVEAELQGRRCHDGRQLPALEPLLDGEARLLGDRAVVGERDLLARHIVEGPRQPLREAPAVDEDHGGAVSADQLDEAGMDGGPHRPRIDGGGHLDAQVPRLLRPRVDDLHGPRREGAVASRANLAAAEEARHLVQGARRGRQADALERRGAAGAEGLQALQREEQVGASLGGDQRVDLVDDHRLDGGEHGARRRGEQEVERLGRGDEDVRRRPGEARPLARRRVARAHRDRGHAEGDAARCGHRSDAGERRAQVLLHVGRQRLERGDVEHPAALPPIGLRREHQPIDRREERRQRLARARRREEQRGRARHDGTPAPGLRRRRSRERRGEPAPNGQVEPIQGGEGAVGFRHGRTIAGARVVLQAGAGDPRARACLTHSTAPPVGARRCCRSS